MIKPLFPVSDFNIDATTVAIIGSGPNAHQGIDRIPAAAYTIALNSGIGLRPDADAWCCVDDDCKNHGWFKHYNERTEASRLYHPWLINVAYQYAPDALFYMVLANSHKLLTDKDTGIIDGMIRGMHLGTVAATAAQIAFIFGARLKRIIYCGVDMSGDQHIDGSTSNRAHGQIWPCVPAFNALNYWLIDHGVECVTVSDTMLDLDRL